MLLLWFVPPTRYADAAKYRDLLASLERRMKQLEAQASDWSAGVPGTAESPLSFRLGQRVSGAEKWGGEGSGGGPGGGGETQGMQ